MYFERNKICFRWHCDWRHQNKGIDWRDPTLDSHTFMKGKNLSIEMLKTTLKAALFPKLINITLKSHYCVDTKWFSVFILTYFMK